MSSHSHSAVFLYFFALITEEGFLISPCYSLELCVERGPGIALQAMQEKKGLSSALAFPLDLGARPLCRRLTPRVRPGCRGTFVVTSRLPIIVLNFMERGLGIVLQAMQEKKALHLARTGASQGFPRAAQIGLLQSTQKCLDTHMQLHIITAHLRAERLCRRTVICTGTL